MPLLEMLLLQALGEDGGDDKKPPEGVSTGLTGTVCVGEREREREKEMQMVGVKTEKSGKVEH